MDYDLKFSLELDVTGKDVEEFFLERPDCLRKLDILFKSQEVYPIFKKFVYQELKNKVKGTELEEEELYNSITLMEKNFIDNIKLYIYNVALQDLISKRIPMTQENVLEIIDIEFISYVLAVYKNINSELIKKYKYLTEIKEELEKEELRQEIYVPSKLLN